MSSIHLAIFGDTHGHLRLMFQLCRLWQCAHSVPLDGILQCGDLGFYPDVGRLDKATKNFAARDPEELGFAEYFNHPKPAKQDELLERTLNGPKEDLNTVCCPVVFCHGNHEDFELLAKATCGAAEAPVDCFQRLNYLRSGEVTEVAGLSVAALGGAPERDGNADGPVVGRCVSRQAAHRLRRRGEIDILITHGSPSEIGGESDLGGSCLIREVVQMRQPIYHFFGHHRQRIAQAHIGSTLCTWLNDVNFQRPGRGRTAGQIEAGCMAVVRWNGFGDHELTIVDEPWFRALTAHTWQAY